MDSHTPVWEGFLVREETVVFVGERDTAPLLFAPTEILSVTDYARAVTYQAGKDFTVTPHGLARTDGSAAPFWDPAVLYGAAPNHQYTVLEKADGRFIYFSGCASNPYQLRVTYRHADRWDGFVPPATPGKLPAARAALQNGGTLKIGILGDSISVGCGSSRIESLPPLEPGYPERFAARLKEAFPAADISLENVSVGGKNSTWGIERADEFTAAPDLAVIAFGMNDSLTPDEFAANITAIIGRLRAANPAVECVLMATMLPNAEAFKWFHGQDKYEAPLQALAADDPSLVLCPMTSMSDALYRRGKRFYDINSNNINHPNDFLHQVYADTLFAVVCDR